jgi:hypothetical protein
MIDTNENKGENEANEKENLERMGMKNEKAN